MTASFKGATPDEMSFLEHLEALRWHVIRSLVVVAICAVGAFIGKHILFHVVLLAPTRPDFFTYTALCQLGEIFSIDTFCMKEMSFVLQSRKMTGQLTMHIGAAGVAGVVVAFPYVFWELWRFIRPALRAKEQGLVSSTTLVVSLLFFLGVSFGYFILVPVAIHFLAGYQIDDSIINQFDIISYVSTVLLLVLSSGLVFQWPLLVYFVVRTGLVSTRQIRQYRRHALVAAFILSALITPPDPFSQLLMALPLMILYEVGLWVARFVAPPKELKKQLK